MTDVMSVTTTLVDRNFSSHSVIVFYYFFGDYGLPLVIIGLSIFLGFFSFNELTSSWKIYLLISFSFKFINPLTISCFIFSLVQPASE